MKRTTYLLLLVVLLVSCAPEIEIGAEFTRQLAKPDCSLVLVARRLERLQTLASELEKLGAQVETLAADLASEEGIHALHKTIVLAN